MLRADVDVLVQSVVQPRRLLAHPFYLRWEAGELAPAELAAYAGQYRHFEKALPDLLSQAADSLPPGRARSLVEANLKDELEPVPHLELFDDFAAAVGSPLSEDMAPATQALVDSYRALAAQGPVPLLAALASYEVQSSEIATSKVEGLRRHYAIGPAGRRFWDVHAAVDGSHAEWTTQALADLASDEEAVRGPATLGATAWWEFLSEREAVAAA
jgi:pyrroloquinoline quinone (PQQ) biosynthesis protein C